MLHLLTSLLINSIVIYRFAFGAYNIQLSDYTSRRFVADGAAVAHEPIAPVECSKTSSPCRCTEVYPREIVVECQRASLRDIEDALTHVNAQRMQILAVDLYTLQISQSRHTFSDGFFAQHGAQPRALVIDDCRVRNPHQPHRFSEEQPLQLHFEPDAFKALEDTLVTLKIDCPTTLASLQAIKKLRSLNVLKLSQMIMPSLGFDQLPFPSLYQLDLKHNSIRQIESDSVFDQIPELENLQLDFNSLPSIKTTVFTKLQKLKELTMSHNGIETIQGTFENMPALEHLDLSHNKLRRLEHQVFAELNSLKILKLESNLLTELQQGYFTGLENLEVLSLHNNELQTVHNRSLEALANLKSLFLSRSCHQVLQFYKVL